MLRYEVIDTMYHLIDRTDREITDILENCNPSCRDTLCFLKDHVDNLKDAMMILDKIHDHEDIFNMLEMYASGFCGMNTTMTTTKEVTKTTEANDKPVIVKKV